MTDLDIAPAASATGGASIRPIAPMQSGMVFHALTSPGCGIDIEQISFKLDHDLDPDRFIDCWQRVLAASSILRSSFRWLDVAEPQRLVTDRVAMPTTVADWRHVPAVRHHDRFEVLKACDRSQDFDLTVAPLQRLHLVQVGDDQWWGLWTFHHAILDGRSFPLVLSDVFGLYDHGVEPPQRPDFDEFVRALDRHDHELGEATWGQRLAGLEPAQSFRVHPEASATEGSIEFGVAQRTLDRETTGRLRREAASFEASLNHLLIASWSLLLHRYRAAEHDADSPSSPDTDIVVGATRACRHLTPEARDTVGLLINTVPLRVGVARGETVEQLVASVREQQRSVRAVEMTPLHRIQQAAGFGPDASLFESLVVFDDASLQTRMTDAGLAERRRFAYEGRTNFPVTVVAYGDDEMLIRLEYRRDHLGTAAAQRVVDQLVMALTHIGSDPTRLVRDVPVLTTHDHQMLLAWNDTDNVMGPAATLPELLERQVELTPEAVALRFGDEYLTYRQFNQSVNRLAHHLRQSEVGPDVAVGVLARRSIEMLVAVHAISKAGGAYVPLDPDYPVDRLADMVEDAGLTIVLAAGATASSGAASGLTALGCTIIDLDASASPHRHGDATNPELLAKPTDAAYIIFTSGSTGRPKGVLNEHAGIVNRLRWMQDAFALDHTDVVLQKTPFTFDVSVWELFWPLQVGAELVIAPPDAHRSPEQLVAEIRSAAVTTIHFVPSMLVAFLDDAGAATCSSLRRVICSGEALPRDLQDRFFERMANEPCDVVELHNLYGPTEAAVDVTWWQCHPGSELDVVPIGFPITNTKVFVRDHEGATVPPGAAGELYLAGVQVARGYVNRPDLTDERFLDATDESGLRCYRTGDLGRFRADGSIEYLGRTDHQVKIRGHRIELGEIESVLLQHPAVAHCVVVDRVEPGQTDVDRRLVGYAVLEHTNADTPASDIEQELRSHLSKHLTDYMVPAVFVMLDELPLSTSGKVDRGALPAPAVPAADVQARPMGDIEHGVARIWSDLLEIEPGVIGRHVPFFQAGGHSLLVIKLASRLKAQFGCEIAVTDLIDHATIAAQAELVAAPAADGRLVSLTDAADRARARKKAAHRRTSSKRRRETMRGAAKR